MEADNEHDWREGSEQYRFIEQCLASADRQKQPWLIFSAHRVLGYTSNNWSALDGTFGEPMGRESLQRLWQKYKVDSAFYGHVHNYERTCPIYQLRWGGAISHITPKYWISSWKTICPTRSTFRRELPMSKRSKNTLPASLKAMSRRPSIRTKLISAMDCRHLHPH